MRKFMLIAVCMMLLGCTNLYKNTEDKEVENDASNGEGTDMSRSYLERPVTYNVSFDGLIITNPEYAYDGDTSTYANIARESTTFYGSGDFILDLGLDYYATSIYYKIASSNVSGGSPIADSTLKLYASEDNSTWTLINNITISSTSAENTVTINNKYRYYKFSMYRMVYVHVYELYSNTLINEENSGKKIQTGDTSGVILASEDVLFGPARFYNGSAIKSFYMDSPSESGASGFRIKCNTASDYVTNILGSGNDGLLSFGVWGKWSMAAISDLEITTNSYGVCAEFKPSGLKIQYLSATIQSATTVNIPVSFTDSYKCAFCKSATQDGTVIIPEITSKSLGSFVAYTATGTDTHAGNNARQFDFILIGI
jgi:hypothetical protein